MKHISIRWETILYAAAFLVGLGLRLVSIGRIPLTDAEAELALQAAGIAAGQDVLLSPQPAYITLTALLMFLTRATDWTARFFPALAGSLLILSPLFFHRWLGRFPAAVLAWGLAIDPGLLAAARTAGGLTIAMLGFTAAVGFAVRGKSALSGIAAGMALLGGPSIWHGLLTAGLAVLLTARRNRGSRLEADAEERLQHPVVFPVDLRTFLVYLAGTLFFVGTLFFFIPRGLGAMAGSLPAYFTGWAQPGIALSQFTASLLGYAFFPLLLGLWGAVRGIRRGDRLDRFLVLWWVVSLAFAFLNPGRQPLDFVWSILPVGTLAARQVARVITLPAADRLPVLGQGLLTALMLAILSMALLSMVNNWQNASRDETAIRIVGALFLLVASAILIGWGWSKLVTLRGLGLGALFVIVLFAVSTGWHSAGLSPRANRETWETRQALPDRDLLLSTLDNFRQWGNEPDGPYEVVVAGVASPALRWALRDDPNARFVDIPPVDISPALVITPDQPELALAAAYRGQSFVLADEVNWSTLRPHEWLRWLAFRSIPPETVLRQRIILWARGDVFPGGTLQTQSPDLLEEGGEPEEAQ